MTSRALIYCRVSTSQQEEDGSSLDTQAERCRLYAESKGYPVIAVFNDTHTGAQYRERPGLSELRAVVREGGADIVICYAVDRLSRNQAHLYIVAEEFEDHNTRLEFVTEDFEDSAVGRFIRSARAFAAEVEREKIAERTVRGRMARIQSGKMLPGPRPLYGYQWRDSTRSQLVVNPDTAPVVERIYTAYAAGASLRSIVAALTRDGIPTATGLEKGWCYSAIRNILKDPRYRGEAHAWIGGGVAVTRESIKSGWTIALPDGTVPAIVSNTVWEFAQDRLSVNRQRSVRNSKNPEAALLRGGIVRCGYCGSTMMVRPHGQGRYSYRCQMATHPYEVCESPVIACHVLDARVWNRVRAFMLNPVTVDDEREQLLESQGQLDTARLDRSLVDLDRQRQNLTRALALADDDETTQSILADLRALNARRAKVDSERDAINAEQFELQIAHDQLMEISEWQSSVSQNIDSLDYRQKRSLIEILGIKVKVWRKGHQPRIDISGRISLPTVITSSR